MGAVSGEDGEVSGKELPARVPGKIMPVEKMRIPAGDLVFRLERDEGGAVLLSGRVDLTAFGLPGRARLYIEVRGGSVCERLDWGTVDAPFEGRRRLSIPPARARRFRFIVVDADGSTGEGGRGAILAECPRFHPGQDDRGRDAERERPDRFSFSAEINFTGKKRIPRNRVPFRLEREEGGETFLTGRMDLTAFSLPGRARVYIEVRGRSVYDRLDWGTVDAPFEGRRRLSIPPALARHFRLIVVDPEGGNERGERGLILAECPQLLVERDDEKREQEEALLPLRLTDIGEEVWTLDWRSDEARMELVLNSRIPDIKNRLLRDPLLQAAILPAAAALVLHTALRKDERWEGGWREEWLEWGERQAGGKEPPDGDDPEAAEEWVREVIAAFCRRAGFVSKVLEQEEGSGRREGRT